MRSNLLHGTY